MIDRVQKRFGQLTSRAEQISESIRNKNVSGLDVDKWYANVDSLFYQIFPSDFPHRVKFSRDAGAYDEPDLVFYYRLAVFEAARDDYENGFLFDLKALVNAEVFSDELEQAEYFLQGNHRVPAAVVSGTVLEATLRALCDRNGIEKATSVNRMNDDLTKAAVYNKMMHDQIQAWAKIRNSAAHGYPDEFNDIQVKLMIDGIRDFITRQMT
ncbi:DUF4145 domain-containing protein [Blastopirellula marina]|uniref:DUF4145 domain-containing protein n=1 Tax=Blastopirellula marina TaxID=124 RepID=A0A2S8GC54_9BACT|nr:DUF4145 domain-containing protein [Blastopirellula marina]PQO42042.1 DUF4145 domain-containing protein [Blastopirellula marina]